MIRINIKKICLAGLPVLCLFGVVFNTGCSQSLSTHHSTIRIGMANQLTMDQRLAEFEDILAIIDCWATDNQLKRIPADQQEKQQTQWHSSVPNSLEQVVHYREKDVSDSRWPIEALIVFNPEHHPYVVHFSMTEGYHTQPSEQLRSLYNSIIERLKENEKVILSANVW